jgi:hypothetical protein
MRSPLLAAGVCLAALSLVAAGCGSDTKSSNDYVKSINKIQTDFVASLSSNAAAPAGSSDPLASVKATFAKIDGGLKKVVAQLKGITPPDKVKSLHQDLITEISSLDSEVNKMSASVNSGDFKQIAAGEKVFETQANKLQAQFANTVQQINTKLHS